MWDKMPKLRGVLNGVIYTLLLLSLYAGYLLLRQPDFLPVRQVEVPNSLRHIKTAEVLDIAHHEVRGNFFTADLVHLRHTLEQLPWVQRVNVQRSFPDKLTINIQEYQALARWNQGMLISPEGDAFWVPDAKEQPLPQLLGPDGSEKQVASNFVQFNHELAKAGRHIQTLTLTPRRAWQVKLDNDWILELGRDNLKARLERFVAAYANHLAAGHDKIKQVDLRYRNGFAVQP